MWMVYSWKREPKQSSNWSSDVRHLLASLGLASLAGVAIGSLPLVIAVYAGIPATDAMVAVVDPSTVVNQFVFCFVGGIAFGYIRHHPPTHRVWTTAIGLLVGLAVGVNLAFGIRYGFVIAIAALVLAGGLGWLVIFFTLRVVASQARILTVLSQFVAPLAGAFSIFVLLVLFFGIGYYLIADGDSAAFECPACATKAASRIDLIEFSLFRMTSFGNSTIRAVSALARALAAIQSVVGVLLFTTYVGILVGEVARGRSEGAR